MKKSNIAIDWDGVGSEGVLPDGKFVIITGRSEEDNDEIKEVFLPEKAPKIYNYPFDDIADEKGRDVKIGIWKAKTIKTLGIEKYYEDSEEQIHIIKEMSPSTEVVKVIDGIPQEAMNFIIFTCDGSILPIAYKLEKEGNRVIVGIIENKKDVLLPSEEYSPEDEKKKKQRLSLYDGMIEKFPADEVLKVMKRIKDKDEWFILTDSNSNYKFTQAAFDMGFEKGMFPTEKDREMECDRKMAKDFVKEHYKDIKVAEVKTFKVVQEGIDFINESEELWALKSLGDAGETIVPDTEDIDMSREQLTAALEEMKGEYEQNGFLLEPRILEPVELTPEIIFWDGVPVCTSLDIELKTISAGSAIQTGCAANLIIHTDKEDRLNKIAFPEVVFDIAKDRKGMFVWDLSILIDKKGTMWFGEYCSNRLGWDAFPTEVDMCADEDHSKVVTPFFASLTRKKDPFKKKFGVGVRILNIGVGGKLIEEGIITVKDEAIPCTYLYEVKEKDGKMVSTAQGFDLGVVTASCDDLYEAVNECYEYLDQVMFEGKFYRPKFDILSYEYPASILRRFDYAKSYGLIFNNEEEEGSVIGRNY